MNGSHVAGGGLAAALGAATVALLKKYAGYDLSDADAAVIGSAALAAGVGVGHAVSTYGLFGAVGRLLHGPAKQETSTTPTV